MAESEDTAQSGVRNRGIEKAYFSAYFFFALEQLRPAEQVGILHQRG